MSKNQSLEARQDALRVKIIREADIVEGARQAGRRIAMKGHENHNLDVAIAGLGEVVDALVRKRDLIQRGKRAGLFKEDN